MRNIECTEAEELAELTPFDECAFHTESSFKRGNMFVETSVLQATAPLLPWTEESAEEE